MDWETVSTVNVGKDPKQWAKDQHSTLTVVATTPSGSLKVHDNVFFAIISC